MGLRELLQEREGHMETEKFLWLQESLSCENKIKILKQVVFCIYTTDGKW